MGSLPLYGGTFARSYSVPRKHRLRISGVRFEIFGPNAILNKTGYLPVAACLAPLTGTSSFIAENHVDKDKSTG